MFSWNMCRKTVSKYFTGFCENNFILSFPLVLMTKLIAFILSLPVTLMTCLLTYVRNYHFINVVGNLYFTPCLFCTAEISRLNPFTILHTFMYMLKVIWWHWMMKWGWTRIPDNHNLLLHGYDENERKIDAV